MTRAPTVRGPLLAVDGLTLRIAGRPLVADVGFEVGAGERVALLGPSGSGKSLTAAAVLGRLPAVAEPEGSVRLGTSEVLHVPAARRDRATLVAAVGQDSRTAMNPLVRVHVQLGAAIRAAGGDDSASALAHELAATGIEDPERVLSGFPGELSGGQRQRVQLAFALATRPHLLVADEPTTALDPVTRRTVIDLLDARLAGSSTGLLFVSHDAAAADELCSRTVSLHDGRVDPTPAAAGVARTTAPRRRVRADRATPSRPGDRAVTAPLVRADGLWRVYPDPRPRRPWRRGRSAVPAVRGVDLTIHAGERVGLVGPSGAGKSSLVRMLLALDHADAGTVAIDGRAVTPGRARDRRWLRRAVQYVPQDPAGSLDPRLRTRALVVEPLRRLGVTGDHDALVTRALERVGLSADAGGRRPGELSGGQAQRVALARALVVGPRLLLADEPVSGLDAERREQVVDLLAGLRADDGTALVVVAHDLGVIEDLCERTLALVGGELVEDRPTVELLADPHHPDVAELVRSGRPRDSVPATPA